MTELALEQDLEHLLEDDDDLTHYVHQIDRQQEVCGQVGLQVPALCGVILHVDHKVDQDAETEECLTCAQTVFCPLCGDRLLGR